jgi:hypothetical protein
MKIHQYLAKLIIGIFALVIPSLGIFVALGYTLSPELTGLFFFSAILAVTLGLGVFLSWFSVRYGNMSVKAAAILTSTPFAVMVVIALPALFLGFIDPVLLWGIPLALAFILGKRSAQSAYFQMNPRAEQVGDGDVEESV